MNCEKCGEKIDKINMLTFNRNGTDDDYEMCFEEVPNDAVMIDTTTAWCGYDMSEEEMRERVTCPKCGKYPFESKDIQVYDIVRVVMFKDNINTTPITMTNLERIQKMTAEEMVKFLEGMTCEYDTSGYIGCYNCTSYGNHHSDKSNIGTKYEYLYECKDCEFKNGLLAWLNSEAE